MCVVSVDSCGSSTSAVQTITVKDTSAPSPSNAKNLCLYPVNNKFYCWSNFATNNDLIPVVDSCGGGVTRQFVSCTINSGSVGNDCTFSNNQLCVRATGSNNCDRYVCVPMCCVLCCVFVCACGRDGGRR